MLTASDLDSRTARIAVIGTGVAGLYQCFEFASHGFPVTGFDLDVELVTGLSEGRSPVPDVPDAALRALLANGRFRSTAEEEALVGAEVFVISVPVMPGEGGQLDTSPLEAAALLIARVAAAPLVVVKTTGYPGMTEEVVLPVLVARFGVPGEDFALVYASERADPGTRTLAGTAALPKVLAGASPRCERLGRALYEVTGGTVHLASSIATA
ncbi:MAG: nucleotide sugar dehydrogenase, partial [Acidimicrobiia bacterium]